MSIQLTGAGKRFRVSAALVALALAVAVFVLATQARSIWSTRNDPQVQPRQATVIPATNVGLVNISHLRPGCRPKYGCQKKGGRAKVVPATNVGLVSSGHLRPGCRPKFGCQNKGGTAEKP
jgi:hypothetical protein